MAEDNIQYEWVEIIEPETRKLMFANVLTGDCKWERPANVPVKKMHDNMWWQLVDTRNNNKPYYFNSSTQQTRWDRPVDGDIIPLAKLQEAQEEKVRRQSMKRQQKWLQEQQQLHETHAHGDAPAAVEQQPPQKQPHPAALQSRSESYVTSVQDNRHQPSSFDSDSSHSHHETQASAPAVAEPGSPKHIRAHSQSSKPELLPKPRPRTMIADEHDSTAAAASASAAAQAPSTPTHRRTGSGVSAIPQSSPDLPRRTATIHQSPSHVAQSQSAPAPPVAPPLPPSTFQPPSEADLGELKADLNTHTKGFFRKKVSIATMMSWSREPIAKPMLLTLNKKVRKDALDIFKNLLLYMGDKQSKSRDGNKIALEIVSLCWSVKELRDELYLQLCKQTTANSSIVSCEKGWELLAIALNFFPPTSKFTSYLQGYITKHVLAASAPGDILHYAVYCSKKLDRIGQIGAKRGQQQPTLEEIEMARSSIFTPSVFDSTLEEIMELQASKHPGLRIPWVLKILVEAVIQFNGIHTEGIFRVPGDIDAVNLTKAALDAGRNLDHIKDPHVPASTLKLWFRELSEPVIPDALYNKCIQAYTSTEASLATLNELPPLNRTVLVYIIRFLQLVAQPENQPLTKMSVDNLSMVWAPNFLRCPSSDPMVIFQNTKQEMQFVRQLVLNLNTEEVSDLL